MLKIGATTKWFFNRDEVKRRMDRGTHKALSRFGAVVMRTARGSIRPAMAENSKRRKRAAKPRPPSLPGSPPVNRTGLLRDHILFAYDPQKKSVVIGPELLSRSSMAQKRLEFGGTGSAHKNPRRRLRKIGQGGEIRVFGRRSKTTKNTTIVQAAATSRLLGTVQRPVTYCKIRTQAQADRANRINEELYGPATLPAASIAPRPYMAPAFQKTLASKNHTKAFTNIITK